MKRILLIFSLALSPSLFGMWHGIKKWLTEEPKQEQLQCPEFGVGKQEKLFAFTELPSELQKVIVHMIGNFKNIESAANTLRALAIANKQWSKYLTPLFVTQLLAKNYNVSPLLTEWYVQPSSFNNVNTKTLSDWINRNPAEFYRIYQDAAYLDSQARSSLSKKIIEQLRIARNNTLQRTGKQWIYADGSYLGSDKLPEIVLKKHSAENNIDEAFGGINYVITKNDVIPELTTAHKGSVKLINFYGITPYPAGFFSQLSMISSNINPLTNFICTDIALQSSGKIIVVGLLENQFALLRLNADGTVDENFGNNGIVLTKVILNKEHFKNVRIVDFHNYLGVLSFYLTVSPIDDEIIFKIGDVIKQYSADGKEIK
ncbi:MAG: delta-60 repeat domain-containing protein [Candidatus Dependentiae bacterium]